MEDMSHHDFFFIFGTFPLIFPSMVKISPESDPGFPLVSGGVSAFKIPPTSTLACVDGFSITKSLVSGYNKNEINKGIY